VFHKVIRKKTQPKPGEEDTGKIAGEAGNRKGVAAVVVDFDHDRSIFPLSICFKSGLIRQAARRV
jgi:hypothetical protein